MYCFAWIVVVVMIGVTKTGQEAIGLELLEEFEQQFEKERQKLQELQKQSHQLMADLEDFFVGHQNINLLTGPKAGTVGLSEFHSVFPAAEQQAECEGKSMLEISKRLVGRQVAQAKSSATQAARSVSGMVLQQDVCKKVMPSNCKTTIVADCASASHLYRTLDGSCNNLRLAKRGAAMTRYNRFLPPAYDDSLDSMRGADGRLPRPRLVTTTLQKAGPFRRRPSQRISHLHMQWGQLVAHDIAFTALSSHEGGCCVKHQLAPTKRSPTEACQPVNVTGDPVYAKAGRTCFFFVRSLIGGKECTLGPREQMNQATHYLDASGVYGTGQKANRKLRAGREGLLLMTQHHPGHLPLLPDKRRSFKSGDVRVIITPALTSLHTLMVRCHNFIAIALHKLNPHWDDEKLFQEARRVVAALIQQITYKEYLPLVLGNATMDKYGLHVRTSGYSNTYSIETDATVANVFVAAAFRFGHSMVRRSFKLRDKSSMSLLQSFSQAKSVKNEGTRPSDFLEGMAKSAASPLDAFFTPILHNSFAATPKSPIGFDLFATTIQRGRDHGLPSYNRWREACRLKTFTDFNEMSQVMPNKVVKAFKQLYRNVDDVDLYPAGLAEHGEGGSLLGPTFSCIVAQQFHHLKHGDRFWYENSVFVKPFTPAQLEAIRRVRLSSILCEHTTINSLQPHVFFLPDRSSNKEVACSGHPRLDLSAWKEVSSLQPSNPFFFGQGPSSNSHFNIFSALPKTQPFFGLQ